MTNSTEKTESKYAYYLGNTMYINVTNLCTNKCKFCIRDQVNSVGGVNLVMEDEKHTHEDIIPAIKAAYKDTCDQIVFCGYGEPLIKIEIVKNVAKFIKENYPNIPTRVNTNGHANLIHKRNVVPELKGLIDRVSISLNADSAERYEEIAKPAFDMNIAYNSVKEFIQECVNNGIDTTASVVSGFENYDVDVESCRKIAEGLGAKFRVREWLPQGYD